MKAVLLAALCALVVVTSSAFDDKDSVCPPEEDIFPCTCNPDYEGISCSRVSTPELINALKKFAGRTVRSLSIFSSVLQHIPHEIFENVAVRDILVEDSTFVDLFDAPPAFLNMLERIHIQKTKFRRISWNYLTPLSSLKELSFSDTEIPVLDENFGNSLPKSLTYIYLSGSNTRTIKPGTFHGLDNIQAIHIHEAELTNLSRDVFPTPFNVHILSFLKNKLSSIPKDLFTQMPELHRLDLRYNNLKEVPEEAFGEDLSKLLLLLDVNPLTCDCGLKWVVTKGLHLRSGTCAAPDKMKGKLLHYLKAEDFNC